MSRRISFIVGSLILFLVFIWILHWAQSLPPSGQILNLSRDVAIGILGSIAASCAFYSALELLLYLSDASGRAELARIKRFEEQYGISDVLLNKSGDNAIGLYQSSIKEARTRVWAMGISNNQFIDQHWDRIKIRKMENPTLEVKILFF